MTKTAILNEIATNTNLSRGQVNSVMDELESVIERHIRKRSVGEFTLPGLLKIKAAKRPATKKRMGRNPATGEEIVIPAKPATTRVRVTALKKLKDMIVQGSNLQQSRSQKLFGVGFFLPEVFRPPAIFYRPEADDACGKPEALFNAITFNAHTRYSICANP